MQIQIRSSFKHNADPDPGSKTNADPDPGRFVVKKILFLQKYKVALNIKICGAYGGRKKYSDRPFRLICYVKLHFQHFFF